MKWGVIILLIALFLIFGCEGPQDPNRPGDKLDGYITFTDTNMHKPGGYHSISIYSADSSYPFYRVPIRTDSLKVIYRVDSHSQAEYSMDGIGPGRIFIASTWSRYPRIPNEVPIVLGTYGCDTSAACTSFIPVVYPNVQGNFRNLISWTDTTKGLF